MFISSLFAQVHVRLLTGRTHQIRAQLAHRGWPLVGDVMYNSLFSAMRRRLDRLSSADREEFVPFREGSAATNWRTAYDGVDPHNPVLNLRCVRLWWEEDDGEEECKEVDGTGIREEAEEEAVLPARRRYEFSLPGLQY